VAQPGKIKNQETKRTEVDRRYP